MKKRLISILCAAAMATSLFAGATVVSAAENKQKILQLEYPLDRMFTHSS